MSSNIFLVRLSISFCNLEFSFLILLIFVCSLPMQDWFPLHCDNALFKLFKLVALASNLAPTLNLSIFVFIIDSKSLVNLLRLPPKLF